MPSDAFDGDIRAGNRRGPVLPPGYFGMALPLMLLLHFAVPVPRIAALRYSLVGFVPVVIGMALNLLADREFKTHETTVKPFERSSHLLTDGVFAESRHPMYLGMVLILGGVAVLLGTLAPFAVVLAFAVLLDLRFIRVGERMLAETFGDGWRLYRRRVRRWL
ncbi:MAG TPA: isoprenylcysteine carboxylmethyltransferase family protein [bacterium]|nr:isoprenylcysteine carboxylmethyltransferase family protein [bacterium]